MATSPLYLCPGGDVFITTNDGVDGLNNGVSLPPLGYGTYG